MSEPDSKNINPSISQPSLSGQQRALYEALVKKDQRLANMYLGSLLVLDHTHNPEHLAHASHSLRELMEKLPMYLDMPVPAQLPTLKDKVQQLRQIWDHTYRHSTCRGDPGWQGSIDKPLLKLLTKMEEFFGWFAADRPTRKQRTSKILRNLDPAGLPLPKPIENLHVEEWDRCHDFFEAGAHHKAVESEEFKIWLAFLERFLLDQILPRTFEDHLILDQIIREGEADANS
jgi:hypothetical protein